MYFERFDRTVYKAKLFYIARYSFFDSDYSKQKNINNVIQEYMDDMFSEYYLPSFKEEIFIQPTFSKQFYKEIITEMLIPVYRIDEYAVAYDAIVSWGNAYSYEKYKRSRFGLYRSAPIRKDFDTIIPRQPVFIKVTYDVNYRPNLKSASVQEVKEYIEKNTSSKVDFKDQLQEVFQKAEELYEKEFREDKERKYIQHGQHDQEEINSVLRTLRKKK